MNFLELEFKLLVRNNIARKQFIIFFLLSLVLSLNLTANEFFFKFLDQNFVVVYLIQTLFMSGFLSKHGSYLFSWHCGYFELLTLTPGSTKKRLQQTQVFYGILSLFFSISCLPLILKFSTFIEAFSIFSFNSTISYFFFTINQSTERMELLLSDSKELNFKIVTPSKLYLGLIFIIPIALFTLGKIFSFVFEIAVLIIIVSWLVQFFYAPRLRSQIADNIKTNKYRNRINIVKQRLA